MPLIKRLFFLISFLLISSIALAQNGQPVQYEKAMVVSAERLASNVGANVLRQGGNAIDAAVAVQFALAVTLPRAGNIGGGGFMLIRLADGTSEALDYREIAPEGARKNMYVRNGNFDSRLSTRGGLAVGVPGTVDGMIQALERYGKLPLETVIQPAIKLAREGYPLSYTQAKELNQASSALSEFPGSKKYFTREDGKPFLEGELFIQEDLANTLENIARFGRQGFYSGEIAEKIVLEVRKSGGIISFKDLRDYKSVWRKPLEVQFKEYSLLMMPPPSSGGIAVAQILEMIEHYPAAEVGFNSADYIHLLSEGMRRAFADRSHYLGDPDFVEVPQSALIDPEYNARRMNTFSFDSTTASSSLSHGVSLSLMQESPETTHYSIVDEDGNAVSVTTTLNGSFGSFLAVSGAGFLLNNEMDDFSAQPGKPNMYGLIGAEANSIAPGKRMLSSMVPAIVTKNDSLAMILGAAGGPRIITTVLQTFLNGALFQMNAQQAVSAPRFHHQWLPDMLYIEPFLNPDTESKLLMKGHLISSTGSVGRTHIIFIDKSGKKSAGVDPRGSGAAAGF